MLQKIKTKKFWISFAGVLVLMLQLFGVKVDAPYVNEIVDSICAVLILVGLMDGTAKNEQNENSDTCSENEQNDEENENSDTSAENKASDEQKDE